MSLQNATRPALAGAKTLVVGEVLWDRFPDSVRLGGAALNFAVHLQRLGHVPMLVSAVGDDGPGEEARRSIQQLGLDTSYVQSTDRYRTGSATVHLGASGQATFTIDRPAAYDAVDVTEAMLDAIVGWNPAWVYFGTLFSSCPRGRNTLNQLLRALPNAKRFYDLNLRPGFEPPDLVKELLETATAVKLNERELHGVHQFLNLPLDAEGFCRFGSGRYGWRGACVTLGARGCAMVVDGEFVHAKGSPVNVVDTVGAGDAFAAAFMHGLVSGWPVEHIAEFANRAGAHVASVPGAIPVK